MAIKRITISKASANVKLEVELGEEPGSSEYTLYLMSDSYQARKEVMMGKFSICIFPRMCANLFLSVFWGKHLQCHPNTFNASDAMCEVPETHGCQGCDQEYNFKLNVKAAP